MENNYRFFSNTSCEYFPCHELPQGEAFNCLFCYCPLYRLGASCGGLFTYITTDLKCCAQCHLPHLPEYYDVIIRKLSEAACATEPPKPD